nr:antitoxin MazE [Nosocomiicoccus ampullae]
MLDENLIQSMKDGYIEMSELNLIIAREGFHLECEVEQIYSQKLLNEYLNNNDKDGE